jgi:hypothetical protein
MRYATRLAVLFALPCFALVCPQRSAAAPDGETIVGERVDTSTASGIVESMEVVIERDRVTPRTLPDERNGAHGTWVVPSRNAVTFPHSGVKNIVNKWGDTRMGIRFPQLVDVQGAYLAGQAAAGAWTTGVRAIGYRAGEVVQETDWFRQIGDRPTWFAMNLCRVDRIEIVAEPVLSGSGWYGLDDLTYTVPGETKTVVDFEDLDYKTDLARSNYAGLTWERGTGEVPAGDEVHAPQVPPGWQESTAGVREGGEASGTRAALPSLLRSFRGVVRGDAGSASYPPDTIGAVGPNHFVETVNRNFAIYNKTTGAQVTNVLLSSFLPGSNGDPRVLFDHHSNRWIVTVPDFDTKLFLAVSLTDNPTGSWFKTNIVLSQGSDAGRWSDYPTLGVDANGIYAAAYMVSGGMSIFAIDKAPLIAAAPSLGTVTAFRDLPWEGAIQPAHTYGTPGGEYFISLSDSTHLRVRRVNPPLTAPTLQNLGTVTVASYSAPPTAPALGSSTNLDTVDGRLMMAMYRNGSIWTAHTISFNGRAACRWYQIDATTRAVQQYGTVADASLYYFFPAIAVNQYGHAVLAFTGSSASQYPGCYYTGRLSSDPAGQMAAPAQYRAGVAAQNNLDSYGRNRWGDYSYTTIDPADQTTFWTIQEYAYATNNWGTYVAVLSLGGGDCNSNGIPDYQDIANGTSHDCNNNGTPDECDIAAGTAVDCNSNGVPDDCDVSSGTTPDCNSNGIPDSCDFVSGAAQDCNGNGRPDDCDVALSPDSDCNGNGVPDTCELSVPHGLAGAYYDAADFTGKRLGRIDPQVNFTWGAGAPWPNLGAGAFSVRWTGFVQTTTTGSHTFYTQTSDGVRLWVAGHLLIDYWINQVPTEYYGTIGLLGNHVYPVTLEYYHASGSAVATLAWQPPGGTKAVIPTANLVPGRDCTGNGRLDQCDLSSAYVAHSPNYTPLGGVTQTFTLPAPPAAVGPVTLTLNARGDLNFYNENVVVDLNGTVLGTVFTGSFSDCVDSVDTLQVAAQTWNTAKGSGAAALHLVPSADVSATQCGDPNTTYIGVTVAYDGVPTGMDCNANGIPDACDLASGQSPDANSNGIPDECENLICRGDGNCDRAINWRDIDYLIAGQNDAAAAWAALFPAGPTCPFLNLDTNEDGHVNWRDIDPFIALMNTTCP